MITVFFVCVKTAVVATVVALGLVLATIVGLTVETIKDWRDADRS